MVDKNKEWVKLPSDSKIYPLIRSEVETQLYLDYCRQEFGADIAPNDEWIEGQIKEQLYTKWYTEQFGLKPPHIYGPPKGLE